MGNMFKKFFKDIFTGRDNRTYDMGRVLWFQSVQAFVLVTIYSLHKGGSFDPVTWGAGLAALIAGGGAALGIKAGTEPNQGRGDNEPASSDGGYLDTVVEAKRKANRIKRMSRNDGEDDEPTG